MEAGQEMKIMKRSTTDAVWNVLKGLEEWMWFKTTKKWEDRQTCEDVRKWERTFLPCWSKGSVVKDDEIWGIPCLWIAGEVYGDGWHRRHWEILGKDTERVNECAKQPTDY